MIGGSVVVLAADMVESSKDDASLPCLTHWFHHNNLSTCDPTLFSEDNTRQNARWVFPLTLPMPLRFLCSSLPLSLVASSFLSLALSFALSVAFALLVFTSTQQLGIHWYNTTSSEICLCSTVLEQHCSDLHVALQSVSSDGSGSALEMVPTQV